MCFYSEIKYQNEQNPKRVRKRMYIAHADHTKVFFSINRSLFQLNNLSTIFLHFFKSYAKWCFLHIDNIRQNTRKLQKQENLCVSLKIELPW